MLPPRKRKLKAFQLDPVPAARAPPETDEPTAADDDGQSLAKPVKAKRKRRRTLRRKRPTRRLDANDSDGIASPSCDLKGHRSKRPRRSQTTQSPHESQPPSPILQHSSPRHPQADSPSTETLPTSPSHTPTTIESNSLSPEAMSRCISLLLDLLGWDVPPEYIVDSGFSLPGILYLFARLRLRLTPGLVERAQSANVPLPPYSILPSLS